MTNKERVIEHGELYVDVNGSKPLAYTGSVLRLNRHEIESHEAATLVQELEMTNMGMVGGVLRYRIPKK
jgi:hypothetical protein